MFTTFNQCLQQSNFHSLFLYRVSRGVCAFVDTMPWERIGFLIQEVPLALAHPQDDGANQQHIALLISAID